ncbi:MAG: GntR family transcriptional regulator [Bacillota bacterium]|nr:GntR family transcriptional regulator [Bacillota bacterium]
MVYKYMRLVDWIKEQVETGALTAGQKLPTEAAMAEQFSVSRHTVRQALAFMENEGLLYSIQGSGTYISEDMERVPPEDGEPEQRSNSIGMLLSDSIQYIFPDIIQGVSEYLMSRGYLLNVAFTGGNFFHEKDVLDKLMEANLAGIIIEPLSYGMALNNDALYAEVAEKIPMLMIHTDRSRVCPTLSLCDGEGTYMLANHLLDMGHTEIGSIYAFDEPTAAPRYSGFLNAMHEKNVTHRDDNDIWIKRRNLNDLFHPEGKLPLERMLKEVTAVICHDDRIAYALIRHLRDQGIRVPEDISVVGYDDSVYATLDMQITSVTHPKEKYGKRAAQAILEMIRDPDAFDADKYVIHPKLVVRNSVRKIK